MNSDATIIKTYFWQDSVKPNWRYNPHPETIRGTAALRRHIIADSSYMLGQLTGVRTIHKGGGKVWQFQWLITSTGVTINAISTIDGRFSTITPIDYLSGIINLLQERKTGTRPETIDDAVEQYQDFIFPTSPIIPVQLASDFSIGMDCINGLVLPTEESQASPLDWEYLNRKILIASSNELPDKIHPTISDTSAAQNDSLPDDELRQSELRPKPKSSNDVHIDAQNNIDEDKDAKLETIFVATMAINLDNVIKRKTELQHLRNHLKQLAENTTNSKAKNLYLRNINTVNDTIELLSNIIYSSKPQPIIKFLNERSDDV